MIDWPTLAYALNLAAWGLVFVALAGLPVEASWRLTRRLARRQSARDRYYLAVIHFAALIVAPLGAVAGIVALHLGLGASVTRAPPPILPSFAQGEGFVIAGVSIWSVGVGAMLTHLLMQYVRITKIGMSPAPRRLRRDVQLLGERTGLELRVRVMIGAVTVPTVTGLVRNTLILPPTFEALPAREREALLLHELAHVSRGDLWANLAQRLLLALIWFQPAAWAMYLRLAAERETACDRLAIRNGASRAALARALLSFATVRRPRGAAMAATGNSGLAWRLRQLELPTETADGQRWRVLVAGSGLALLIAIGGSRLAHDDTHLTDLYFSSALGPVIEVAARDPAGRFTVRVRQGRIIAASIEERDLPRTAIIQQGGAVTLLDAGKQIVVSFSVTPAGRIAWQARSPQPSPT